MNKLSTAQSINTAENTDGPSTEGLPREALEKFAKSALATNSIEDARAILEERAEDRGDVAPAMAAALFQAGFATDPETGMRWKAGRQPVSDGYSVVLTPYSAIEAKLTEWAWDRRIPRAALALQIGTEGLGKTAMGTRFVADLTRGRLPGCFEGQPVNVAQFTPEDDPSRTNRPRLDAAGADLARVFDVKMRRDEFDRGFSLPDDTERIVDALVEHDIRFVFADPLASLLDPRINSWKDTDIREALEPLVGAAAKYDITILGSLHTNKTNSTDPRQRGMGSAGWQQVARAALLMGLDPEDPTGRQGSSRCIALTKHNLGPWMATLKVTLATAEVQVENKRQEIVRADLGDKCDASADQMLAAEQGFKDIGDTAEDKATNWLRGLLENGPMATAAIRQSAEDAGHSWRTIERAKKEIGIVAEQIKGSRGWRWRLPEDGGIEF